MMSDKLNDLSQNPFSKGSTVLTFSSRKTNIWISRLTEKSYGEKVIVLSTIINTRFLEKNDAVISCLILISKLKKLKYFLICIYHALTDKQVTIFPMKWIKLYDTIFKILTVCAAYSQANIVSLVFWIIRKNSLYKGRCK